MEKVIKGLECCISGNPAICKRVGCPYAEEHDGIGDTCIDHLMADALALLKAQEPRVETWEEAQANVQDGPFIIFEVRDSTGITVDSNKRGTEVQLKGYRELVMCKNCKWWDKDQTTDGVKGFCPNTGCCEKPDFYCADGERRGSE